VIAAVTIFVNAQVAIWRMTSDEPGPEQKYALEARKHIAALRAKEPGVKRPVSVRRLHEGGAAGDDVICLWVGTNGKGRGDGKLPLAR